MTDPENEKSKAAPAAPEQFAHKNPPVGPRTNNPLPDWRKDRDYENFNPTPEK